MVEGSVSSNNQYKPFEVSTQGLKSMRELPVCTLHFQKPNYLKVFRVVQRNFFMNRLLAFA